MNRYARAGAPSMLLSIMMMSVAGCATMNVDESLRDVNAAVGDFTQGNLQLAQARDQHDERAAQAASLLQSPLNQTAAVQLALVNDPAMQALLAQHWADGASIAQAGRLRNPLFSFERMHRIDELEFGRLLSFGLIDLLTLPRRYDVAQDRLRQAQSRLALQVVAQVTRVRQAWVQAVAAQQSLAYAAQVNEAAQASAELASRMQAAGNFSRLQRARQQAFYAEAAAQFAAAQQTGVATRERLVRLLGLSDVQARSLGLPDRLPDLPDAPRTAGDVSGAASSQRLDIRVAASNYQAAARAQGLGQITSLTDIELGVRRDTIFDDAGGGRQHRNGYEISVRLPVFDGGAMRRDVLTGHSLAAANTLEATLRAAGSRLRETYGAYRTAYDLSRHYRDEVVPLRKTIADENVLRYNGMLISVFELLADTRAQIDSVIAAIAAERRFWLADAALQASIMGAPVSVPANMAIAAAPEE